MISLQNISKSYTSKNETVTLFTDLNWQIQTGSYVSLMGASGAGKSSILSLIAGIISPDSGTIELGDTDITQLSTDEMIRYRWQHIAFIFQSFELIPNLTVEENIDLVLDISHAPRRYETSLILDTAILVAMYFRVSAPQITVDVIVGRTNAIHIKNAVCTPLY